MSVTVELVMSVDANAIERAQRLEHAMRMLRGGLSGKEARRVMRERYSISVATAWRIVDAANDLVGDERDD